MRTVRGNGQYGFGRRSLATAATITLLAIAIGSPTVAQDAPPEAASEAAAAESEATAASETVAPAPPTVAPASGEGLYFSDVIVRGQPLFQVGSLANLSARDRAQIINRRIASFLERVEDIQPVSVEPTPAGNAVTLRANNRVLMTVTQQDAEDFGLSVEELAQQRADALDRVLDKPPLAIDVAQRLQGTLRQLLRSAVSSLPSVIGAILVIAATWGVAAVARRLFGLWAHRTEGDRSTEILIGRLGYGGVWVVGSVVALGVLGLDIGAMLGALGLTSVAIGFSLKDVLSNYISGVILLAARPFGIGDQVVIKGYEGTIVQIQLRATTLRTYDGRVIYIPNQEVFQASITNNTAATYRRSSVMVGIDYEADISKAIRTIKQSLDAIEAVELDPPSDILVSDLAASTVNLEVRFWVDSRRAGFLDATSRVRQTIKEALQTEEIEMPTDIYTLAIRNFPTVPVQVESRDRERSETQGSGTNSN